MCGVRVERFIAPFQRAMYVQNPMSALDNIAVVLVEPSVSGNIGSVARVLKTTGLSKLALVNPPWEWRSGEARRMAHGSAEILDSAEIYDDIAAAVGSAHLVIGTTHRHGRGREVSDDYEAVLSEAAALATSHRVAIVFGRERDGLWRREIQHCHRMVRIPSAVSYPSFNLSHAVLLMAYGLFGEVSPGPPVSTGDLATAAQQERLYDHIIRAMTAIDFRAYNDDTTSFQKVVRRFLNRAPLERRDAMVIHRFCSQVLRYARRGRPESGD